MEDDNLMARIKITADSTVDLPPELLEQYNISTMSLDVLLGDDVRRDGIDITPEDIYSFVEKTGKLPKTSAINAERYTEFFNKYLADYDYVIHFSLSSGISMTHNGARMAAEDLGGRVKVLDSLALSTGTALLAIDAAEQVAKGVLDADAIFARAQSRIGAVQTSFVIDKLEYLYKGGRCNMLSLLGANLLKIKPSIVMKDGKLAVGKKFRGKYWAVVNEYVDYILDLFNTPDLTRVFVTHTAVDPEIVQAVKDRLAERFPFCEILETVAGSTITAHCGPGTLGILYLNDGTQA